MRLYIVLLLRVSSPFSSFAMIRRVSLESILFIERYYLNITTFFSLLMDVDSLVIVFPYTGIAKKQTAVTNLVSFDLFYVLFLLDLFISTQERGNLE